MSAAQESGIAIKLRPMRQGDVSYIVNSWVMSEMPWRGAAKETGLRRNKRSTLRTLVEAQIATGKVVVACSQNHESTNVGWACGVGARCLYAYVSHAFRGQGIGHVLMREVVT